MGARAAPDLRAGATARLTALVCFFVVAVFIGALHVLRSDCDPRVRHLSEYAVGPYGALMTSVFVGAAVGAAALACMFWRSVARSPWLAIGCLALLCAAATDALMAIYVTDLSVPDAAGHLLRTAAGRTHDRLANLHGLSWLLAVPAITIALCQQARWRCAWAIVGGIAVMLALATHVGLPPNALGATQRLWVGAVLLWGFGHAIARGRVCPPPR